jgi:murein DD-endopeptidase MepM/ murein hydrolase activator NlpD
VESMSDRVLFYGGRAWPRLALTGLALLWLSGCSSDATRLTDLGKPFANPFSWNQTADAAPTPAVTATPLGQTGPVASAAPVRHGPPQPVGGSAVGWTAVGGSPIVVAQGETLDSLSGRYGVPASALLSANGLSNPAQVRTGMRIVVPVYHADKRAVAAASPSAEQAGKSAKKEKEKEKAAGNEKPAATASASKAVVAKAEPGKPAAQGETHSVDKSPTGKLEASASASKTPLTGAEADAAGVEPEFRWPARGRIIQGFKAGGNDGINISVPAGTSVRAAESGVVVYSGDGLKGYGNLVLIKHPNGFVSAYGNNGELDVKRGDTVKRGQVIAKSGDTGNVNAPQLHFELRKGSTPVDPTSYLAGL